MMICTCDLCAYKFNRKTKPIYVFRLHKYFLLFYKIVNNLWLLGFINVCLNIVMYSFFKIYYYLVKCNICNRVCPFQKHFPIEVLKFVFF